MAAAATALGLFGLLPQHYHAPKPPLPSSSLKPLHLLSTTHHPISSSAPPLATIATVALPILLNSPDALAAGGEFGILEGRTFALGHPIIMSGLFLYTLWAGYLGWQWRRIRTIQDEINQLKKELKPAPEVVVAVTEDKERPPDQTIPPTQISGDYLLTEQIDSFGQERKALLKGNYRERHFNAGSILLGFGVLEAVGGCLNTWFRTGKLFPGPHLFAGAAITVLWASAAALVPAMQKGNDSARSLHIALNALNVILFIWQIPTGIEIVFKVFEFTSWP